MGLDDQLTLLVQPTIVRVHEAALEKTGAPTCSVPAGVEEPDKRRATQEGKI